MRRAQRNTIDLRQLFTLVQLAWRNPMAMLVMLLAAGGWYGYEYRVARPAMTFKGVPQTTDWHQANSWFRVLRNKGFILGYSDLRGNPLWVMYNLHPVPDSAPNLHRPSHFSPDWRGLDRVTHESYTSSGYDRGHLAPNYAMSRLYGTAAQANSFLMTNIAPQKPHLNQQWWQRLESVEIDYFARQFSQVWVVTGPVFDPQVERLKTAWSVEIPDAFYKIYITEPKPGKFYTLAFLVPQNVQGKEPLDQFLTSIDTIESKTGLDFFYELDDDIENRLEATIDASPWQLQKVARLPPRY
ncbi:MAG: DNA/RNA non-specific endonuclease [Methylovulum sp.]|nr:DNA/RNA non-specific endonuclease [Methylovulum sp.]